MALYFIQNTLGIKKQWLLALLAMCFYTSIFSQEFIHYTQDNGLPSNKVYMVTLDKNGFIWCTTNKGIAMFNGEKFRIYTTQDGLPVNDLWKIYAANDGKIWYFGRSKELGYIENGRVFRFPSGNGLVMNPTSFDITDNDISIISSQGSYHLEDDKWKNGSFEKSIIELAYITNAKSSDGSHLFSNVRKNIIITVSGNYLTYLDTNLNVLDKYLFPGPPVKYLDYLSSTLLINNRFFYYMVYDRLVIYDVIEKKGKTILMKNYFSQEVMKELHIYYTGKEVVINGPVGRYILKGDSLKLSIAPVSIENQRANGFFLDSLGNTWISTFNKGIYMYPLYNKKKRLFPGENVQQLHFHQGNVYAGVESDGLYKIYGHGTQKIPTKGKYFYEISSEGDSSLKVLTEAEIGFFKHEKCSIPEIKGSFLSMLTGKYFFGTLSNVKSYLKENGVCYLATGSIFAVYGAAEKTVYAYSGIYHIVKYHQNLVLGSTTGIKVFDYHSIKEIPISSSIQINKLLVLDESLLIATEGKGLYVYNGKLELVKGTERFFINNIRKTGDRTIWISTNLGAHEIQCDSGQYTITRSVLKSNGLSSNIVNDLLVINDSLFCATDNGLIMLKVEDLQLNSKPNIIFTGVSVNDSLLNTKDTLIVQNKGRNIIYFNFDVAYLNEHEQLKKYYLIEPITSNWVPLSSNNFNINGLKPGTYRIRIKVEGFNGNTDEKSFVLIIQPRWFERRGFIASMFILGIALVLLIVYYIIRSVIRKRDVKHKIETQLINLELYALRSKLNPHFIFNTFNSIQLYINKNDIETSERDLVLLSKHIRNVFEYSHLQNIALEKEILLLRDYLAIEKIRFGDKIITEIKTDPRIDTGNTYIPSMIIQPYVENSMVHGLFHKEGVGHLTLEFNYINPHLYEVKIIDDGIGFTQQESERVSSTKVINERVHLINQAGDFDIQIEKSYLDISKKEKGTIITIRIKNKQAYESYFG